VEWPANTLLGFECLDYAVSGRLQTDFVWNLLEVYSGIPDNTKKDYGEVVDSTNIFKALGIYPVILLLLIGAMIYTGCLKFCRGKNINIRRQYSSLERRIYYDSIIRFFLEVDLKLVHQGFAVAWFVGMNAMVTSAFHAIFGLAMIFFPLFVLTFICSNKDHLLDREKMMRFGTLYDGIRVDETMSALYSFWFLVRRTIFAAVVVFLSEHEYFKVMSFLWLQTLYMIYVGWNKPHLENSYNVVDKINEFALICLGYLMFLMTHYMRDQEVKYEVGWLAVFICLGIYALNFLLMLVVFLRELAHAYKMYKIRRKFILQYGRKEMIEQNYFKSSRDAGMFRSVRSGGSSRDDGPMKSRRRTRRRHRDRLYASKSSLVQKNDIDDVYTSGQPDELVGPAKQDYYDDHPSTRKFLKQLKEGTKIAHGLKQIEEVEEAESDGSFGSDHKYKVRSPAKSSRERRRRNRERDQETA
jgi:hypothetical protein